MVAAYVLAGELGESGNSPEGALQRYEKRLHAFMLGKQEASEKICRVVYAKDLVGVFLRNQ